MDKEIVELDKRISEASARIMELGDSVRIFVTRYSPETGQTVHMSMGAGNWYAQESQVREWLMQVEERVRNDAVRRDEE